jgi:multicomponent K+:H+ antiporter subunit E
MSRVVPHSLVMLGLVVMWLLLTRFSLGQLVLGSAIAYVAVRATSALELERPRIRRWRPIAKLFGIVAYDILRSNIAVAQLILGAGQSRARRSGFIEIPMTLRNRSALAIVAIIVTSTPGTAWMEYHEERAVLILHVFDLVDEAHWVNLVKSRYEALLLEIFE